MTRKMNEAFLKLCELPKFEYYARPRSERAVVTNICELIRSRETDDALCLCGREEKYRRGEVSDFEYFRELLRALPLLKGTHIFDLVNLILDEFCNGADTLKNRYSHTEINDLWREANEKMFAFCNGEYLELLRLNNVEKLYNNSFGTENRVVDEKCHTPSGDTTFVFDFKGFDFIRPDPYHYELAKNKENCGEKLNNNEKSIILAQEIYLLLSDKNRGKIQLHLRCDESGNTASELIKYLKDRGFSVDIFLAFEGEGSVEKLISLCLMSNDFIRIYPEILISKTDSFDNLKRRLRLLFGVYPAENIRFGGAVTDSPTFFLEHILFRKALFEVLFEIEQDEQKAFEKARKIILNR